MLRYILLLTLSISLFSCTDGDDDFYNSPPASINGLAPIYESPEVAYRVEIRDPKDIVNPGKIFAYKQFLIVTIINEGFHVIDNSDPVSPRTVFFIAIPGNTDVAVKDDIFFANNYNDLVSFTFDASRNLQIIERLSDAMQNATAPLDSNTYFECVDPSKGVVIGWESKLLDNPKCYKQ
ncbi:MAG: hypothetical protein WBA74_13790 [Cyclobacteriaceae bacterium]